MDINQKQVVEVSRETSCGGSVEHLMRSQAEGAAERRKAPVRLLGCCTLNKHGEDAPGSSAQLLQSFH